MGGRLNLDGGTLNLDGRVPPSSLQFNYCILVLCLICVYFMVLSLIIV